jgi:hypothetical protein
VVLFPYKYCNSQQGTRTPSLCEIHVERRLKSFAIN